MGKETIRGSGTEAAPSFALRAVHHVAIIVSDYEKSKDFYVNKLGFGVVRELYRPEACGLRHLAFRVEDARAASGELERRGIPCEPVRLDPCTGTYATFFFDPDGLPLELHE